jgi:hypothetical protein
VWKRFGDAFEYFAGVHQDPPPDTVGRNVVFVDFCYKRDVMLQLAMQANGVLVLDHHQTAADDLLPDDNCTVRFAEESGSFGEQVTWRRWLEAVERDARDTHPHRKIYTVFDLKRSGAGIAWDFFHPNSPRPSLIDYVEDHDLWRHTMPFAREITAYVSSHEYTFDRWSSIADRLSDPVQLQPLVEAGGAIERKHLKDVRELVEVLKQYMVIGAHRVPVANLPYTLASDAGHLMCQQPLNGADVAGRPTEYPPFAACYWDTTEGRVFTLRSIDGGADVSEIARLYGGGGHRNAAGFRLPPGATPELSSPVGLP